MSVIEKMFSSIKIDSLIENKIRYIFLKKDERLTAQVNYIIIIGSSL